MNSRELNAPARTLYDRCIRIAGVASALVPERRRDDWLCEWDGELWYRASVLDQRHAIDRHAARRLMFRTLGAFARLLDADR
jgi:hypothetical protein